MEIREKNVRLNTPNRAYSTRARGLFTSPNAEKMNEKLIERKLREEVKRMDGLALKFPSPYFTGMPDRIVLLPGGKIAFAEIKTTGKKPSPRQKHVIGMLRSLGFTACIIDSQESLDEFIKNIR